jgi:hypothetical protein
VYDGLNDHATTICLYSIDAQKNINKLIIMHDNLVVLVSLTGRLIDGKILITLKDFILFNRI